MSASEFSVNSFSSEAYSSSGKKLIVLLIERKVPFTLLKQFLLSKNGEILSREGYFFSLLRMGRRSKLRKLHHTLKKF
jgi:hypothetical protein